MSRSDRILVAAGGGALVLVAVAGWMLLAPWLGTPPPSLEGSLFVSSSGTPTPAASGAGGVAGFDPIVVDVQGGVAAPGIRELPSGSRVADAIRAAGGYGVDADLEAAASLNLAEPLADGQQVRVPRIGDAVVAAAPSAAAGGGGAGGGPINLNTATPEELEALPGIGPVTVQKIVAARTERPFASLEDAVTRGVINRGQLDDIRGLATAG